MPRYRVPCTIEVPAMYIVDATNKAEAKQLAEEFAQHASVDDPELVNLEISYESWLDLKILEKEIEEEKPECQTP